MFIYNYEDKILKIFHRLYIQSIRFISYPLSSLNKTILMKSILGINSSMERSKLSELSINLNVYVKWFVKRNEKNTCWIQLSLKRENNLELIVSITHVRFIVGVSWFFFWRYRSHWNLLPLACYRKMLLGHFKVLLAALDSSVLEPYFYLCC